MSQSDEEAKARFLAALKKKQNASRMLNQGKDERSKPISESAQGKTPRMFRRKSGS